MSLVHKIRKKIGNNDSVDRSQCYNVQGAISAFISSGVGNFIVKIGIHLGNVETVEVEVCTVPTEKDLASTSSSSSSTSGDDSVRDCTDNYEPEKKIMGVKVENVDPETFAHGFGIRNNDIIISVNDQPAKSAAMVATMIQRILKATNNCMLRMEIHREERGLIKLDNKGEDLCELVEEDDMIQTEKMACTLKNVRFKKYLMVDVQRLRIGLSTFRTPLKDKIFTIKYYQRILGETDEQSVALVHNETNKWIYVDNGNVTLQDEPPANGRILKKDSNYLFNMLNPDSSYTVFQPVNETSEAIGFTERRSAASLIDFNDRNARFEVFIRLPNTL